MTRDRDSATRPPGAKWLPNALTVGRLLALPALWRLLSRQRQPTSPRAGWFFAAIALTDVLDGYLARRLRAQTRFGRVADPLADRLLVAVGLLGLIRMRRFSAIGPALLLARDLTSIVGFAALTRRGVAVRVDGPGKASSALVMAATGLALAWRRPWIDRLFWASVAASLATLVHYGVTASRGRSRSGLPRPIRSHSRPELEGGAIAPQRDEEH